MRRDDVVDLDGRVLRQLQTGGAGRLDATTELRVRQSEDLVWGRYSGGVIRLGFFVGTSDGETVSVRFTQLSAAGETASGSSVQRVEQLDDGRVRLRERWVYESRPGEGTAVLEEVQRAGDGADPG